MYYCWRSSYQEGRVRIQLTGFTLPHCCACLKQKPGIPTSYVVVFMCHQWLKMRGDSSFCWYGQNCWPPLFKLSFRIQLKPRNTTHRTVPIFNRKIRGNIDTSNTHMQGHSLSCLGRGTSIKSGEVTLVLWTPILNFIFTLCDTDNICYIQERQWADGRNHHLR
jgi:hypothetical protein